MRNLILVIFLGLDGVLSESRASRKRRVVSRFNCVFDGEYYSETTAKIVGHV